MRTPLLALGAAALVATASPAAAQVLAQVVPAKLTVTSRPGATVGRDISVSNLGESPAVVRVRLVDWLLTEQGEMTLLPAGATPATLAGCVRFEPQEFSLQPGESGWIRVTMTLPADGPPTRWGVLMSEVRPATPTRARGPRAVAELGTTLYLTSAPPERAHADLVGIAVTPCPGDSLSVAVRVHNPGERHVYVTGDVALADSAGTRVASGSLATGVMLPGGVRTFTWKCPSPARRGWTTVTATLDTGEPELAVGEVRVLLPLSATPALARRDTP
jgi:P pilus assembly chaperone PapD